MVDIYYVHFGDAHVGAAIDAIRAMFSPEHKVTEYLGWEKVPSTLDQGTHLVVDHPDSEAATKVKGLLQEQPDLTVIFTRNEFGTGGQDPSFEQVHHVDGWGLIDSLRNLIE